MKTWSENLIELSREYLNYCGTRVKSINGEFGILNIDYENKIVIISISNSNQIFTFNSVDEIIDNGWAVD
jgi:hypothetical protein